MRSQNLSSILRGVFVSFLPKGVTSLLPPVRPLTGFPALVHVDGIFVPQSSHCAFFLFVWRFPACKSLVLWVSLCFVSSRLVINGLNMMGSTLISDDAAVFIFYLKSAKT